MTKKQKNKKKKHPAQPGSRKARLNIGTVAGLLIICLSAFFVTLNIYDRGVDLSAGEFGLFRVESATRYRYAKMVAEGGEIPAVDSRMQYPEGFNVRKYFTTLSQRTIGYMYRLLGFGMPFHKFVIYFMFAYSMLSVAALFLIAFSLSKSQLWSLLAAALYATSFAFSARRISGGMIEEDFALPLIFFSLFFILKALEGNRKIYPVAAGLLGAAALSAWHFSQFFYLILFSILAFIYFIKPPLREKIFSALWPILLFFTTAGLVVPVLRGGHFVLSFVQILLYALVLTHLASRKINLLISKPAVALLIFILLFSVMFTVSRPVTRKHAEDYGHVYTLLINKLQHGLSHPTSWDKIDKIPFDAKVLWVEDFSSPSIRGILILFAAPFLLLIFLFIFMPKKILKSNLKDLPPLLILLLFIVFIPLYILVFRLNVFLVFFLMISIGIIGCLSAKKFTFAAPTLFITAILVQSYTSYLYLKPVHTRMSSQSQDVVRWMNRNIPSGSVILADIGFSPEIVLNSNFSTVLHNHYEAKDIRDKTKEFYESLFAAEETLWEFCRKYRTDYLLYQWSFLMEKGPASARFQVTVPHIFKNSAAYRLHFDETNLQRFELYYQNNDYRLFKVLGDNETPKHRNVNYSPFFNKRLFVSGARIQILENHEEKGPIFNEEYAGQVMNRIWEIPELGRQAEQLQQKGDLRGAENSYREIISIDPYSEVSYINFANFYMRANRPEHALKQLQKAINTTGSADSYFYMISALEHLDEYGIAKKYRREARSKFPGDKRFK